MRVNGSCLVGSSPGKVTVPLEPEIALVNNDHMLLQTVLKEQLYCYLALYNVIAYNSLFCTIIQIYKHWL